ncbi:DUF3592 domain-containing protein [Streptomyces sp. NPDC023723]|uniref:DUF3592 domain-containing protein n=1 Tax=Streptomyces sp. NPDC023723 TaxID=3154323 RepID=UPI0033FFEE63
MINLILLTVWLTLSVISLFFLIQGRRFKRGGVVVEALCVGHFTPAADGYAGSVLEYSVAGLGPYRAEVTKRKYHPAEIGQTVQVLVNPKMSGRAVLQSERDSKVGLVIYLMMTAILALIFVADLL